MHRGRREAGPIGRWPHGRGWLNTARTTDAGNGHDRLLGNRHAGGNYGDGFEDGIDDEDGNGDDLVDNLGDLEASTEGQEDRSLLPLPTKPGITTAHYSPSASSSYSSTNNSLTSPQPSLFIPSIEAAAAHQAKPTGQKVIEHPPSPSSSSHHIKNNHSQKSGPTFLGVMAISAIITALLLALRLFTLPSLASPVPQAATPIKPAAGSYWLANIKRQGVPAFGPADYKLFRNVKDYGAVGDGNADDTAAINRAIAEGNRCYIGCDSSTTTPAMIYLPAGTYKVSKPIIMMYYSQIIGDINNPPTLLAAPEFEGMAVIDADPYLEGGKNVYTNQNNFFRQVRNLVIDLRKMPMNRGAGIHWQVAQATSLQNIRFEMHVDASEGNKQLGIFMDNGSGGFMTDLVFNGGQYGAFLGSQQFTIRNMVFNNCQTAVYMNWNWGFALNDITINNCGVGIDMANGGQEQTVGSVLLLDSKITNTPIGVTTAYNPSTMVTNGTLILDNVDMSQNVPMAVGYVAGEKQAASTVLAGNQKVKSWVQGRAYKGGDGGKKIQETQPTADKPAALLDPATDKVVTRTKPQYSTVDVSNFKSVKAAGAKGDGKTDDSDAIQKLLDSAGPNDIIYFDHGAYLITKTIEISKDAKITGEFWPLLMAGGNGFFKDQNKPQPMLRVGKPGDVGTVEITELMIETKGPQPGAVLMEWNVAGKTPGAAGMWDTHFRIGGSAGTELQSDKCAKTPDSTTMPSPECMGAFMLLHLTESSSAYLENDWFWVSDHELDLADHSQINIYNGRGVLIESTKATWLWGTSSEHNVLYNYQLSGARNVYMSMIQTETAYFQGNPDARTPFASLARYADPNFDTLCPDPAAPCARTVGLGVQKSSDVYLYGGGLYSFFDNYGQDCVKGQNCQQDMVHVSKDSSKVFLYALSTKAAINMVTVEGKSAALDADNRNNFCATLALFQQSA